jgi:hypothetical protein
MATAQRILLKAMDIHKKPIIIVISELLPKSEVMTGASFVSTSITFNHGVLGSSPSALTKEIKRLSSLFNDVQWSLGTPLDAAR